MLVKYNRDMGNIINVKHQYVAGIGEEPERLVLRYHYSHMLPKFVKVVVTEYIDWEAVATVFFNLPPTRWSEPVLELSRLVRKDGIEPKPIMTKLISAGMKECKKKY